MTSWGSRPLCDLIASAYLVCSAIDAQSDQTTDVPPEEKGLSQTVLLSLIGTVGSLLLVICICIICLLCVNLKRNREGVVKSKSAMDPDENEAANSPRFFTNPPVTGTSARDVSRVVEITKPSSTGIDENDDVAKGSDDERSFFATLVDRPVVNPEDIPRSDSDDDNDVKEIKVMYLANYQRRDPDISPDVAELEVLESVTGETSGHAHAS